MRARLTLVVFVAGSMALAGCPVSGGDTLKATLNVTLTGSGDGTVTVTSLNSNYQVFDAISCSKAGLNCSATTDLDVEGTTLLTLTARPGLHSTFVSWSGSCVATFPPNESVIEMNEEKDYGCTATFQANVVVTCNNPLIISSTFDTDADWERNEFGAGVSGSNPSTGGNDGGYRLGGLDRPVNGFASFQLHALHHTGYDPAADGAITGIEYSEDRIVHAPVISGEGIKGGLYLFDGFGGSGPSPATRRSSSPAAPGPRSPFASSRASSRIRSNRSGSATPEKSKWCQAPERSSTASITW
jgi:hypothetical protein